MVNFLRPLLTLRDSAAFVLLAMIVAISRIPFLGNGYGTDPDAWRVVAVARSFVAEGVYSVSRFPGYPVQEILSSLLLSGGPWALNGATAFFSIVATVFFALSIRRLEIPHYFLAGLALAFTPLVYVNSVNSMDYIWALAFLMIGLYSILRGWAVVAGIALGLAVGCRLTSAVMIVPLVLLLWKNPLVKPGIATVRFGIMSLTTAAIAFWPVYSSYGWEFLTFYDVNHPGWLTIFKRMTLHVWGRVGLFALVAATAGLIFWPRLTRRSLPVLSSGWAKSSVWWLAIALYVAVFFRLPLDAAYLIPIVPFVILLLAKYMKPKLFALFVLLLMVAPYLSICRSNGICPGDILVDHRARSHESKYITAVLMAHDSIPDGAVVVAGWWQPHLSVVAQPENSNAFRYLLDETSLADCLDAGCDIYYLRGMAKYNHDVHNIDLLEQGAKLLQINPLID